MLNLPENELFSAYIDGELTSEEQARVEEILATSAEARQLVDDLRSLSQSLQALPAYQLDHGLAESVLRRAEREMLSQPAAPLPKFHQVEPVKTERARWAARFLRPRNFIWSAVAIGVAVVLMMESEKAGRSGSAPSELARSHDSDMLIEPVGGGPVIEAVEEPQKRISPPAAIARSDAAVQAPAEPAKPAAKPAEPPTIAGNAPKPAESAIAASQPAEPKALKEEAKAAPLLVYECRPAEGLAGAEALADAFKQCGVALDGSTQVENGEGLEVQLTPDQVARVISHLQSDKKRFSEVVSLSTATHAGPRIPSAVKLSGSSGAAANLTGEAAVSKTPGKVTVQSQNQIAIQPKSAPAKPAAEAGTTGIGKSGPARPGLAKSATVGLGAAPEALPVYRVRFLFKPPAKRP